MTENAQVLDGLRVVSIADASILILERVTDAIREALEARLVEYCYGRVKAEEDPDYYSFELTVQEFFEMYDKKSDQAKLGLAGELIVHLLLPHGHESFVSACVYLNKEERNVKKGFDLTFREDATGSLWYGEVKSGRVSSTQTADIKARELVGDAELGLHKMFTTDIRKKRWDAAILDADATLQASTASSVKKLLRADFKTVNNGASAKVRALLCAVVVNPMDLSEIAADTGSALIANIAARKRFDELRLLLIQQADLEDLIGLLRDSLKAAT